MSIVNAVIYKELVSLQTFSVSIEDGVKHFCWCFSVIGGTISFLVRFYYRYQMVAHFFK